jgi:hypothetical protein
MSDATFTCVCVGRFIRPCSPGDRFPLGGSEFVILAPFVEGHGAPIALAHCERCSGTGFADHLDSLVDRIANTAEHRAGLRAVVRACIAHGYDRPHDPLFFVPAYPAGVPLNDRLEYRVPTRAEADQVFAYIERERAKRFTRENGVDTTAKTIPPQPPTATASEGERDCSLSNSVALRNLAGILFMRADASRAAIAERARAEIVRLRNIEISPPSADQFAALDAQLSKAARTHELAIPAVDRARVLLRSLRHELMVVDVGVTRSNRYRLEMETLAGAGHPVADEGLRIDVQLPDGDEG